tara:strand:+ start:19 stop:417 length:399 start_codon:yes stop_codon:yes gene_type:complete
MADAVTSTTLQDGVKKSVLRFTNVSDGSGEAAVAKVDASTLGVMTSGATSTNIKITQCWWSISGMDVDIIWNATANIHALTLTSDGAGYLDFRSFGGLQNTTAGGKNGDILFTTRGHTNLDTYTIVLEVEKG